MWHAQLDAKLAKRVGAAQSPDGPQPNVRRAAITALFGADSAHQYTNANVSGPAEFGPLAYANIECAIDAAKGRVLSASHTDFYYNYSARYGSLVSTCGGLRYVYACYDVNATLNNGTHFLRPACTVRPVRGKCAVTLTVSAGKMSELRCECTHFIDDVPPDTNGLGTGFAATAAAFEHVFKGTAYKSLTTGCTQENNTFALLARFANNSRFVLQPDLLSHMQRTLWHIPILSWHTDAPADQRSSPSQLGGFVALRVADKLPCLVLTVDFRVVFATVLLMAAMAIASVLYVTLVPNTVGRVMIDSLVHTMTITGRNEPAIPGVCLAGFDEIFAAASDERVHYGVLVLAIVASCGYLGVSVVSGDKPKLGKLELGRWYG
jgi:hypothetical protein